MKDIELYPTEYLIKEIVKRSEDCLVLYSFEDKEQKDELRFDFLYRGDLEWLICRLKRSVIPKLKDDLDDEDEGQEL